jgi:hypothetical protein
MQQQLAEARDLIKQKRYREARALLKTIDHPKAREWLARLDVAAPKKPNRTPLIAVLVILLTAIGAVGAALITSFDTQRRAAELQIQVINGTMTSEVVTARAVSGERTFMAQLQITEYANWTRESELEATGRPQTSTALAQELTNIPIRETEREQERHAPSTARTEYIQQRGTAARATFNAEFTGTPAQ